LGPITASERPTRAKGRKIRHVYWQN